MIFRFLIGFTLLVFFNAGYAVVQQSEFSKLVVFGDSLSDTGNLAFFDLPPPFFQNRISDGPLAADLVAEAINSDAQAAEHLLGNTLGFNYAVVGGNIVGIEPEDLEQQLSAYLNRVNNQADPDALYFIFIGGNDLRDVRSILSSDQASNKITEIVNKLRTQLTRLKNAGARAFLIPNVVNIGRIPETLDQEDDDPGIVDRAENYTREYNLLLRSMLNGFSRDRNISISAFDLFESFENLIQNASSYGFTETTQGCFDFDGFIIEMDCLVYGFESRVFFDNVHPSSATNRILAEQLATALPALPIDRPRPSSIVIAPILNLLL